MRFVRAILGSRFGQVASTDRVASVVLHGTSQSAASEFEAGPASTFQSSPKTCSILEAPIEVGKHATMSPAASLSRQQM